MLMEPDKITEMSEEQAAKAFIDQSVMTALCRALDSARLPPDTVLRLLASALGSTYRQVAAAHASGSCPCGWEPCYLADVRAMQMALEVASGCHAQKGLRQMDVAGRA